MILDLFEEVCGARLTYSYITIGGVHDDLPEGWVERCQLFLDYLKPRIAEYHALLTTNQIFVQRTAGIGIMSKELALSHGCTGPMLRGSLDRTKGDPDWDLRKTEPYCGYEGYTFKAIIPPFTDNFYDDEEFGVRPRAPRGTVLGDCWHRFYVRMLEVVESIRIVEQGLKKYATAQGSHRIEMPRHLPAGEAYAETECPRGQMGFYVVGGPGKSMVPLRVRARSSSFCNLSVTDEICRGCLIADVPAIVGSIDIVMGEIDR
jgi:NADH-quinone oxidoreductase subunit D